MNTLRIINLQINHEPLIKLWLNIEKRYLKYVKHHNYYEFARYTKTLFLILLRQISNNELSGNPTILIFTTPHVPASWESSV